MFSDAYDFKIGLLYDLSILCEETKKVEWLLSVCESGVGKRYGSYNTIHFYAKYLGSPR